jgi:hypothetical protein
MAQQPLEVFEGHLPLAGRIILNENETSEIITSRNASSIEFMYLMRSSLKVRTLSWSLDSRLPWSCLYNS